MLSTLHLSLVTLKAGLSFNHHNVVPALSQARSHGGRERFCNIDLAVVQIGMPQHVADTQ